MSLSDLAAIGSLVSGIAVLISLVYLSIQIRQSARNQQATIQHQRAALVQDISRQGSAADMMEISMRGGAGDSTLDPIQSARYAQFSLQCLWLYEEYFYQHREGMLGASGWATNQRRLKLQLSQPGFRAAWRGAAEWFEADFVAYVDGLLRDQLIKPRPALMISNWAALATEEIAKDNATAVPA